jgi:serine/threonine-protein kinase
VTRRTALGAIAGAVVGAAATSTFAISRYRGATPRRLTQFAIPLERGNLFITSFNKRVAISRDGAIIAFNLPTPPGQILVRSLGDLALKRLEGVLGVPFFGPLAPWLGYIATDGSNALRKISLSGGAPITISNRFITSNAGATWAETDTIYIVPDTPGGLARVSAAGGSAAQVAKVDFSKGERLFKFPHALPGGKAVLVTVATVDSESFDDAHIAAVSIATGERKPLVEGGTCACYSPSGHLVYARGGNLLAVSFDPDRVEVTGQPFKVLEGVQMSRNTGVANFDVSVSGDLVYIPGKADGGARTLHLVGRDGTAEKLPLPARSYLHPRISPDGRQLAIEVEGSSHDVFVHDFKSGVLSNLTTDGVSHWPIWSPDGKWIGYRSGPMGRFQLWQIPADRSGPPRRVAAEGESQSAESYSPDGQAIAYTITASGAPNRIAVLPLGGAGKPQPLDDTRYAQGSPKFSPDGRWIAYCAAESGKPQVYVKAFPGPGPKIQVSNDGGTDPVWKRTGGELFYRRDDSMMAVPVSTTPTFSAGRPQELWKGHYSPGMSTSCGSPGLTSSNYDVTPDGQHFLMIKDDDQDSVTSDRIIVVQAWDDELRRLASRS